MFPSAVKRVSVCSLPPGWVSRRHKIGVIGRALPGSCARRGTDASQRNQPPAVAPGPLILRDLWRGRSGRRDGRLPTRTGERGPPPRLLGHAHGLAVGGQAGLYEVLSNLLAETDSVLALSGFRRAADLDASTLTSRPPDRRRLPSTPPNAILAPGAAPSHGNFQAETFWC